MHLIHVTIPHPGTASKPRWPDVRILRVSRHGRPSSVVPNQLLEPDVVDGNRLPAMGPLPCSFPDEPVSMGRQGGTPPCGDRRTTLWNSARAGVAVDEHRGANPRVSVLGCPPVRWSLAASDLQPPGTNRQHRGGAPLPLEQLPGHRAGHPEPAENNRPRRPEHVPHRQPARRTEHDGGGHSGAPVRLGEAPISTRPDGRFAGPRRRTTWESGAVQSRR